MLIMSNINICLRYNYHNSVTYAYYRTLELFDTASYFSLPDT